jgi:hypothetical protein
MRNVDKCVHCFSYRDGQIAQDNILLTNIIPRLNLLYQWIVEVRVESKFLLCLYVTGFRSWGECVWERDTFHSPTSGAFSDVSETGSVSLSKSRWRAYSLITRMTVVSKIITVLFQAIFSKTLRYKKLAVRFIPAYSTKVLFILIVFTD